MEILFDTSEAMAQKPAAKARNGAKSSPVTPVSSDPVIPKSHEFIVNNAHKNVSIFSFDKGT